MHNLAAVHAYLGPDNDKDNAKLSEAVKLLQRALQLSQRVTGPWSPPILRILGNQVNILLIHRQEKYEQAERLAREVLTLRREERALREIDGEEMAGLSDKDGQVAMKEGRYKEAESIFREGLVTGMA